MLAITPLLTILFANIVSWLFPDAAPAQALNFWSVTGALLVVAGSAITALSPLLKHHLAGKRQAG